MLAIATAEACAKLNETEGKSAQVWVPTIYVDKRAAYNQQLPGVTEAQCRSLSNSTSHHTADATTEGNYIFHIFNASLAGKKLSRTHYWRPDSNGIDRGVKENFNFNSDPNGEGNRPKMEHFGPATLAQLLWNSPVCRSLAPLDLCSQAAPLAKLIHSNNNSSLLCCTREEELMGLNIAE